MESIDWNHWIMGNKYVQPQFSWASRKPERPKWTIMQSRHQKHSKIGFLMVRTQHKHYYAIYQSRASFQQTETGNGKLCHIIQTNKIDMSILQTKPLLVFSIIHLPGPTAFVIYKLCIYKLYIYIFISAVHTIKIYWKEMNLEYLPKENLNDGIY